MYTTIKANEIELKGIYTLNKEPMSSLDHANNLGFWLGCNTWKCDSFTEQLNLLVKKGVLTKLFHTYQNEYIEAVYNFRDGNQVSFFGNNHMALKLYYNY